MLYPTLSMPTKRPPNILLILTDQLRPDAVGFGPDGRFATPNINRIAAGSIFTACQTVNPLCQPARTALLTGKYTHQIGLRAMSGDLSPQHPTFPRALRDAGYHTAAVGKLHYLQTWPWGAGPGEGNDLTALRPFFHDLGFDHVWQAAGKQLSVKDHCDYCDYLQSEGLLEVWRTYSANCGANQNVPDKELEPDGKPLPFEARHHIDEVICRRGIEALEKCPTDQPFFLMVSFCSPHKPFDPPQEILDQIPYEENDDFLPDTLDGRALTPEMKKTLWRLRRAYLATVKMVDTCVGRLLDTIQSRSIADNTLVLFSSDHGEMMGDHFRVQKSTFWRNSLTVPTAVLLPGAPRGLVHRSPVELTDLTATILDAAGLDAAQVLSKPWPAGHDRVPCRSLLPMVRGEADTIRDCSFSEGTDWECLQTASHKYVRLISQSPGQRNELLFDLVNDPTESINVASAPDNQALLEWFRIRREEILDATPAAQLTHVPWPA